ncbi:MAG: alpha/beta fold hydrolase [Solirubrobacteraceae bacterium]|nr:alpha/beta fold hydrolase [Solirubrobacteraceae bacterium]
MPEARNRDVRVAYEEHGPADGEPLVLIMGLGGGQRSWWRMVPHLAETHRVITVDNRGIGGTSDPPLTRPLTISDMARDVVAVLDDLEIDAAHIHGMSLGGMISQRLGLDHRDRVRSLALGCTTPGLRPFRDPPPWALMLGSALGPVAPKRAWRIVEPSMYARATIEHRHDRIREDLAAHVGMRVGRRTIPAQIGAASNHRVAGRLHELAGLPVTVIHGDEDRLIPISSGRAIAARIPGARMVELFGCGHVMPTDAEHAYVDALREHLARASAEPVAA